MSDSETQSTTVEGVASVDHKQITDSTAYAWNSPENLNGPEYPQCLTFITISDLRLASVLLLRRR